MNVVDDQGFVAIVGDNELVRNSGLILCIQDTIVMNDFIDSDFRGCAALQRQQENETHQVDEAVQFIFFE